MPEIKHEGQPSITGAPVPMASKEAARTDASIPPKSTTVDPVAQELAKTISASGLTASELERQIEEVLKKAIAKRRASAAPVEPDWSNITEAQAMSMAIHIPVIEHEIPDYMNVKLKDTEFEVVWASRDQRRLGQLAAEGYEFFKPGMEASDFKLPLQFDSEGMYIYADVVCMRVHKRILYGKRRKALQVSLNQLSNRNRPPRARVKDTFELSEAVGAGVGSFYDSL